MSLQREQLVTSTVTTKSCESEQVLLAIRSQLTNQQVELQHANNAVSRLEEAAKKVADSHNEEMVAMQQVRVGWGCCESKWVDKGVGGV